MTNHFYLLVTPSDEYGVSRMMQAQGRKYVQYFEKTKINDSDPIG